MANTKELQNKLDIQKWLDSEAKGTDTCGAYAYCAACDKTVEDPCAVAFNKASAKKATAKAAPVPKIKKEVVKEEAKVEAKKEAAPAKKPTAAKAPAKKTTKK